ncbi:MAG: CoA transferase [Pseudomonadaceae bacterium]|nr:CoA transferase [Pseudomonadaceae bacterium]
MTDPSSSSASTNTPPIATFEGVRVLDFTQVLSGPFATQQLASFGAEVIKVEMPGSGDMTRRGLSYPGSGLSPSFVACNIGKRSITLNLKHEAAREIVTRLVQQSDVLVQNFVPGVMRRLGFDFDAMRKIKPDLIYVSISGFGQEGDGAELPAFDGAIQASSGLMSLTGDNDAPPTRAGYFVVDMATALNTAFATSAALFRRERTGEGQHVDVAMQDTAVMLQAPQMTSFLLRGNQPRRNGNRSPTGQGCADVFPTADGYLQISALKDSHASALFDAIGMPELKQIYPDARARSVDGDALFQAISERLATEPTGHWQSLLEQAGVPVALVRALSEVASDAQLQLRPAITEVPASSNDPSSIRTVAASHTSDQAPPAVKRPAPGLGEHTQEVMLELGYSAAEIQRLRADGAL